MYQSTVKQLRGVSFYERLHVDHIATLPNATFFYSERGPVSAGV